MVYCSSPPSFNVLGSDGGSVPLAVILPACDGDVSQQVGQFYYETLRVDPTFESWATTAFVSGANHNFFNRNLGPDNLIPVDCPMPLSAEQQQEFLVDYATSFLRSLWADQPLQIEALADLGLDMSEPVPQTIAGVEARTVSFMPKRLPLLTPINVDEIQANLTSGQLRLDNVNSVFCEAGFNIEEVEMSILEACRRPNFNQPGQPSQLLVHWTAVTEPCDSSCPMLSETSAASLLSACAQCSIPCRRSTSRDSHRALRLRSLTATARSPKYLCRTTMQPCSSLQAKLSHQNFSPTESCPATSICPIFVCR